MKEIPVSVGKTYAVTTAGSCTVTDADGRELCTAESGSQSYFTANGYAVTLSDDAATVTQVNFKQALAVAGILGGGDKLPAGYTRLDFLESTGLQYIDTGIVPTAETGLRLTALTVSDTDTIPFGSRNSNTTQSRFYAVRPRRVHGLVPGVIIANGFGWGYWSLIGDAEFPGGAEFIKKEETYLNWFNNRKASCEYGAKELEPLSFTPEFAMYLFAANIGNSAQLHYIGRISCAAVSVGTQLEANFIPALDPTGIPCLFDLVSKQALKNDGSGAFIAGVKDSAQLRTVLRKLPDRTGADMGTLTLSLPAEANTPEMQELLDTTESMKNWELTIQERAAEVATYTLRRVRKVVWVRKLREENGSYVDADGERWQTEWCSAIYSPQGNDPTLHGYEPFDSVEQAVEAWGLVPYEYPEELSTEV